NDSKDNSRIRLSDTNKPSVFQGMMRELQVLTDKDATLAQGFVGNEFDKDGIVAISAINGQPGGRPIELPGAVITRGLCMCGRRDGTPYYRDAAPVPQPRTRVEEAREDSAQTCRTRTRKIEQTTAEHALLANAAPNFGTARTRSRLLARAMFERLSSRLRGGGRAPQDAPPPSEQPPTGTAGAQPPSQPRSPLARAASSPTSAPRSPARRPLETAPLPRAASSPLSPLETTRKPLGHGPAGSPLETARGPPFVTVRAPSSPTISLGHGRTPFARWARVDGEHAAQPARSQVGGRR
ncbi:hypothetical protein T492DRAFT_853629, partial [Pavlovales sp. CCMP2436]